MVALNPLQRPFPFFSKTSPHKSVCGATIHLSPFTEEHL